jgi:PIN domain nuclease of toxin-antitoxin system
MDHALAAGALPAHHNDPFDRMLIAQARLETLTLVTHDARFAVYDVPLLRA